jgi:hypothetical protein
MPRGDEEANTLVEAATREVALGSNTWRISLDSPFMDPDPISQSDVVTPTGWAHLISHEPHGRHALRPVATGFHIALNLPALAARLDRFVGDGWMAVGDAALDVPPPPRTD